MAFFPRITFLLIVINFAIFFYTFQDLETYLKSYGFQPKSFLEGSYYTIISSIFLHLDLKHLIYNMVALFYIGWVLERSVETKKFLLVYFGSGILGNLSLFFPIFGYTIETIGIGASAAISGLIGLGSFIIPFQPLFLRAFLIPLPFIFAGALYLIITLVQLFVPSQIAYSAHLFGLIFGAILGFIWSKRRILYLILFISIVIFLLFLYPYLLYLIEILS